MKVNLLFRKRIDYLYENYIMKNKTIPQAKSDDVFPSSNSKIGNWFYDNKRKIKTLANNGDKKALALLNNTPNKAKFFERINFVYENYVKFGKYVRNDDCFPDGVLIKNWFRRNVRGLEELALNNTRALEVLGFLSVRNSKKIKKISLNKNMDYVIELILFILNMHRIPLKDDLFYDGLSMGEYIKNNKNWFLDNINDCYVNVLCVLINNIDNSFFNEIECSSKVKVYR